MTASARTQLTVPIAVVAMWMLQPSYAAAQKKPPVSVAIVDSVPLPISGTVTVQGESSVTVVNPSTQPVPVRNVDDPRREPVQFGNVATGYSGGFGAVEFVTVPAGKRLVIEHASAWVNVGSAGGLLAASLSTSPTQVNQLPCSLIGQNALNFLHACTGPTRHYVEAGQTLRFAFETLSSSTGFFRAFVAGYYETVP